MARKARTKEVFKMGRKTMTKSTFKNRKIFNIFEKSIVKDPKNDKLKKKDKRKTD